jgi:RNA polymerase sigma-70 factor, ECF subfamily
MSFPDRPEAAPDEYHTPITAALAELREGVAGAADRLAGLVYKELHRIAERAMRRETDGHTLQPTELVSEAFIRLVDQRRVDWQSRAHFFAVAAQTMRRLLVDHARARHRLKRDHGLRVTLDEAIGGFDGDVPDGLDLLALDEALTRLQELAPRPARVVELRFFGGLEVEETAEALDVSPATVKRDWTFARAFLLRALDPDPA